MEKKDDIPDWGYVPPDKDHLFEVRLGQDGWLVALDHSTPAL